MDKKEVLAMFGVDDLKSIPDNELIRLAEDEKLGFETYRTVHLYSSYFKLSELAGYIREAIDKDKEVVSFFSWGEYEHEDSVEIKIMDHFFTQP